MERATRNDEILVAPTVPLKRRRPLITVIVMAFLGYASVVALPLLLLSPDPVPFVTQFIIGSGGLASLALLVLARQRVTFELTRVALGAWAARGLYAVFEKVIRPAFASGAESESMISRALLVIGVCGLCWLFAIFGFGRGTRAFYGVYRPG